MRKRILEKSFCLKIKKRGKNIKKKKTSLKIKKEGNAMCKIEIFIWHFWGARYSESLRLNETRNLKRKILIKKKKS